LQAGISSPSNYCFQFCDLFLHPTNVLHIRYKLLQLKSDEVGLCLYDPSAQFGSAQHKSLRTGVKKISTKGTMAAQRTQRRDFDKAIHLDFFLILDVKPCQHLTFVSFVLPLGSLC
jgi:hypothetical protein